MLLVGFLAETVRSISGLQDQMHAVKLTTAASASSDVTVSAQLLQRQSQIASECRVLRQGDAVCIAKLG
jgi:hypothetical protein